MHDHSRFQRDIDDVTGVSLSLSLLLTKVTHAQSFLLFPIVFGINLIHFFDGKKNRTGQDLIICLGFSITRCAARAI